MMIDFLVHLLRGWGIQVEAESCISDGYPLSIRVESTNSDYTLVVFDDEMVFTADCPSFHFSWSCFLSDPEVLEKMRMFLLGQS